ncbi:hypothetical protein N8I71_16375 [Roseibacterium sp. SDUM158016]|uniref:hypothetical protein n=1 Tax=Roseicyclus sediminis TaxID=2980997 RepID=UPI0021D0F970|nr:hypothetical protein [Roseibacterium sp. SDUM158016]MCU4654417.1 hypothetical protein [Roseibacterium sp. SDUM158016]
MSPPVVRLLFRIGLAGFVLTLAAYAGLVAAIAWPDPFFRHARGGGLVTFHSTSPLPAEAEGLAREVTAAFVAAPLGLPDHAVDVWLVDEGWPVLLFFAGSRRASGLTYPVASTRNVFLRHADLPRNRLVRGDLVVSPPRTLSYYLVHEITHLMVAERVGRMAVVRMPRWVNEGFADYVALGPAPPAMVALAQSGAALPAALWGTYARERVCVTLALARLSGDLDALFALGVDMGPDGACPVVPQFGIAPAGAGT